MATKQYIGARYVPKFFEENNGEWLSNTQYEPLTIVQYSGNSYTSKKEVPANIGNPSSNPLYWASTGNYNAQVEAYRQEVEDYKEDVEAYKEDTEEEINGLRNYILGNNRKFIFIGDSYCRPEYGNIIQEVVTRMGITDYIDATVSGTCFGNGSYLTYLQNTVENLTDDEKTAVTDVIVIGGINDSNQTDYNYTTIVSAIATFCNYVKTHLPNAIVRNEFCGNCIDSSLPNNVAAREMAFKAYQDVKVKNYKFYQGHENILHNYSLMRADKIHPTLDGGKEIAQAVCMMIMDCDYTYVQSMITETNAVTGIQGVQYSSSSYTTTLEIIGNNIKFYCSKIQGTFDDVKTIPTPFGSLDIPIIQFTGNGPRQIKYGAVEGNVYCDINDGNPVLYPINAVLFIVNDVLTLRVFNSDYSNSRQFKSFIITDIWFNTTTFLY